jgi:uncharacterized membrane protein
MSERTSRTRPPHSGRATPPEPVEEIMDINEQAPAVVHEELQIAADAETVWAVLSGIERWPVWNKAVRNVTMHGPIEPGTTFDWKAGPGTIKSRLADVDAPRRIAWTGVTMGIRAVDVFRFEARDGGTLVREDESWEGLLARLFRGRMQRMLRDSIRDGLRALKAEAERRDAERRAA